MVKSFTPYAARLWYHSIVLSDPAKLRALAPGGQAPDAVVIQASSLEFARKSGGSPINPTARESARTLGSEIRSVWPNARLILYETHARGAWENDYLGVYANPAEMQEEINAGYHAVRDDFRASYGAGASDVAPAGDAWGRLNYTSTLYKYLRDAPSNRGAVLSAMTIYSAIYRDNVSDIPVSVGNSILEPDGLIGPNWSALAAAADAATGAENAPHDAKFLTAVFSDLLQRPVTAMDTNLWLPKLASGELNRTQLAAMLQTSDEYRLIQLKRIFGANLGRQPGPGEANAFLQAMKNGATVDNVTQAVIQSPEYFRGNGGTADRYIAAIYRDVLGRPAGANELAYWRGRFQAEGVAIAGSILNSLENRTRQTIQLYSRLLRRPADSGALASFPPLLQTTMRPEGLEALLAGSGEYYARFS